MMQVNCSGAPLGVVLLSTLDQRISDFLRDKPPPGGVLVEEIDANQYLLQMAEGEVQAAQERLEKLKRDLAERAPLTIAR